MRAIVVLAVMAAVVVGCGRGNPIDPLPSNLAGRWFFSQWEGYGGAVDGEPFAIYLAFIAVSKEPAVQPGAITLISDHGPIQTKIDAFSPGSAGDLYQLYTITLSPLALDVGDYKFDRVRVTTGQKTREYSVGSWELEVVQPNTLDKVLDIKGSTVGGTELSAMEIQLQNTSMSDAVTIRGLQMDLPRRGVTSAAYLGPVDGSPPPWVTIPVGATRNITFDLKATANEPMFVYLKPLLRYSVGSDSIEYMFGLLPQAYAPFFDSDEAVGSYLRSLPASASGQ